MALLKLPASTLLSIICVILIRRISAPVSINVLNKVIGVAIANAVEMSEPVIITIAHPTIDPIFISKPEAPILMNPKLTISIEAPTASPVFKSPKNNPTSVQVINGLSKFKRPNIRESNLPNTAIRPITNAFNNIYFSLLIFQTSIPLSLMMEVVA